MEILSLVNQASGWKHRGNNASQPKKDRSAERRVGALRMTGVHRTFAFAPESSQRRGGLSAFLRTTATGGGIAPTEGVPSVERCCGFHAVTVDISLSKDGVTIRAAPPSDSPARAVVEASEIRCHPWQETFRAGWTGTSWWPWIIAASS
jgi:hypothetical protein